jgi:hypothetical protein
MDRGGSIIDFMVGGNMIFEEWVSIKGTVTKI